MYGYLEYLTLALIPGFLVLDLVYRKRHYETTRFWRLRAAIVTIGIVVFTNWVGALWASLPDGMTLLEVSRLGTFVAAVVGIVVYEFVHYWYHRAAHSWHWLWRAAHQMHHSAESLDAFGANYLHPLDAALFASAASLVFFPVLGLNAQAATIATLFLTFNAMFQHANISTPYWLGFLIQRPESHNIHHNRGVHRFNYSDLPLWDAVFGTLRNPRSVESTESGFYPGASTRVLEMPIGRDVTTAPRPARPGHKAELAPQRF